MVIYSLLAQAGADPPAWPTWFISGLSFIVAVLSLIDSKDSKKIAKKSNTIAEKSKDIANYSNTIALNRDKIALKDAAINLFFNWAKEREDSWSYAVEFAASLDAFDNRNGEVEYKAPLIQTWQFWRVKPIKVRDDIPGDSTGINQKELLQRFRDFNNLPGQAQLPKTHEQEVLIATDELVQMRWLVMSYFNLLEVILLAWKHETVDTEMLVSQFQPLVKNNPRFPINFFKIENPNPKQDNFPIPKISFPTIAEFIEKYGQI